MVRLQNEFNVASPVVDAWKVMTDVERVATCLPGAELTGVEGADYLGLLKVKVGPIQAQYRGAIRFVEMDDSVRRIVLRGEGRDARSQGTAGATIELGLAEHDEHTRVTVQTDLQITGKVAQFGRSILADVSERMVQVFAQNLEAEITRSSDVGAPGVGHPHAEVTGASAARGDRGRSTGRDDDVLDLLGSSRSPVIAMGTGLLATVLAVAAWRVLRRR